MPSLVVIMKHRNNYLQHQFSNYLTLL